MTVFVLTENWEYEGGQVLGIFSTKEKAEEYLKTREPSLLGYFEIDEWTIDEPEEIL